MQAPGLEILPYIRHHRLFPLLYITLSFILSPETCLSQVAEDIQIRLSLQAAQEAQRAKDYDRAAQEYLKILKLRPKWALMHQNLGLVYHLQGRYRDAIAAFAKAVDLDMNLWGSHLFLGISYYKTNQFSKAIPALQKALKLNPKEAETEARFWLGASYLALDRYEDAIDQFRQLSEVKPKDIEVLYNLAQAYSRFSSVIFEKIGKIDPNSAVVHRLQAERYESQGRLQNAIDEYKQVIALRPDWEGVHSALGNMYLKQGRIEEAIREFENEPKTAMDVESGSNKGAHGEYMLRGIDSFRRGEFKDGIESLKSALKFDPFDERARLYLARCYFELGWYEEAVVELEGLIERSPDNLDALYWLGKAYLELASATLQKMIDVDPNSYRVHQMLGELYEEKTQYSKAIDSYKTALRLFTGLPGIRFAIGNVYWKMRQFDEATIWLEEELKLNPYHALASYRLGSIYVERNRPDLAIPYLERSVQANPGLLGAYRELGKALTLKQKYEEAISKFKIVASGDPEDASIHFLLANAYKKLGKLAEAEAELKVFRELDQKRLKRVRQELGKHGPQR